MSNEKEALEQIAVRSTYSDGVMAHAIDYCFRVLSRHIVGSRILELGPAEGLMTRQLDGISCDVTVVEGSETFCDSLKVQFPSIKVMHSLFEDFEPNTTFDTIVLGHVLEHVESPAYILRKVRTWLSPGGVVFAAVPNANSIHRQAAVLMRLLDKESSLNEADFMHGHRRVFNPVSFQSVFTEADFKIKVFGGYWLKPLSNRQIESAWSEEMIEAFMTLGERYPDIAGEIYILAAK